jgi:hypothetical protein
MTLTESHATDPTRTRPAGPPRRLVLRIVATQLLLAALVGGTFVVMYAGLQRDPQPHRLPVAVVGARSARAAEQVLGSSVAVVGVRDVEAARRAVRTGSEIAGFSSEGHVLRIYVAGPNGSAENAAAEALGSALARGQGRTPTVIDVVPLLPFDPRGLASFYAVLGVTVGSFILAQALYALRAIAGSRTQLGAIAVFAVLIAVLVGIVVDPVLGLLPLPLIALVPVLALLSIAVSATARALTAWFDSYGITAATLLMTAVGLSTSGGIIGQDLLPHPVGAIGSLLPPGAGFRSVVALGYFGPERAFPALLALAIWTLIGVGGLIAHDARTGRRSRATLDPST